MKGNSSKAKSKRSLGGFTLVELIVVIAILAILAGVGAVAYTGYIEYAKKGQDRATVGEIMHALELADYANPGLFGENGGVMVVFSKDGIKAVGGKSGSDINGALKDAFGDLNSTTLSYEKWGGKINPSVLTNLGDNEQIKAYLNIGQTATFANDFEEYWDVFSNLITGLNNGTFNSSNIAAGTVKEYDGKIIDSVVSRYKNNGYLTDSGRSTITSAWNKKEAIANLNINAMDLTVARNFAFISYANSLPLTSEQREDLNAYQSYLQGGGFASNFWEAADAGTPYLLSSHGWDDIINGYFSGNDNSPAYADAMAYLGLMAAATEVKTTAGEELDDDAYLDTLSGYVGLVGNVLSGNTQLTDITTLVPADGSFIAINATKSNGVLRFNVSPDDANPRTGSGSDAPQEEVVYTANNSTVACQSAGGDTNWKCTVIMHANEEITVTIKEIPGLGIEKTSTTGDVTCTQSGTSVTIKSGISGGTILISWDPSEIDPSLVDMNGSITIDVVVK